MLEGQRLQPYRYNLVPRTLVFLVDGERVLLVRVAPGRGAWEGLLNGIGGHIERGEHPLASARREVQEETGLRAAELHLCGVVAIDTQEPTGIGLFVFVGRADSSEALVESEEGRPGWFPLEKLNDLDVVEDLPRLIPRAREAYRSGRPFVGLYTFDETGDLQIDLRA